jgi:hypothetical protein
VERDVDVVGRAEVVTGELRALLMVSGLQVVGPKKEVLHDNFSFATIIRNNEYHLKHHIARKKHAFHLGVEILVHY